MAPRRRTRVTVPVVEPPTLSNGTPLTPGANPITLPAVAVTGSDFDVDLQQTGLTAPPVQVRLTNESPYTLQVTLGGASHWLRPWDTDAWPNDAAARGMHVHPIALTSPLPPSPSSTLLVTVAPAGQAIPGTYPAAATRQAAAYTQQENLKVYSVTNATVNDTLTLPVGIQGVGVLMVWSGTFPTVDLTGHVSGYRYFSSTASLSAGAVAPTAFPILATAEVSIDVLISSPSATTSVYVVAIFDPLAVQIWSPGGAEANVNLFAVAGTIVGSVQPTPPANALPVIQPTDYTAPPWMAPRAVTTFDAAALGAGATSPIVSGVTGELIYVFSILLQVDSAPGAPGNDVMQVKSSSAGASGAGVFITANSGAYNAANYAEWFQSFGMGVPCTLGDDLQIRNPDTSPHKVKCSVAYSGPVPPP